MRSRDIKPSFYKNDQLAECSFAARLLFPGLWMLADREGRLEYRPKRIKIEIFPYDDINIESLLHELHKNKLIEFYVANGEKYILIPTFKKHQTPHVKEKESTLPEPEEFLPVDESMVQTPCKHHTCTVQEPDKHFMGAEPPSNTPSDPLEDPKGSTTPEQSDGNTQQAEIIGAFDEVPCKHGASTGLIPLTPDILTPDILTPDLRERASNSPQTESQNPKAASSLSSSVDQKYIDFAREYQETILAEHGGAAPKITDKLIKSCAAELEKAVRLDGFDFEEIQKAVLWARKDKFWQSNMLSLARLRKKNGGLEKIQNIVAQYRQSLIQKIPKQPGYTQGHFLTEGERREANNRAVGERVLAMMDEQKRRAANAE